MYISSSHTEKTKPAVGSFNPVNTAAGCFYFVKQENAVRKPNKTAVSPAEPAVRKSKKATAAPTEHTIAVSAALFAKLHNFSQSRGIDIESFIRVATTSVMRANRYYDLDTVLCFGKFSGERMETVIRIDPGYVSWAVENITGLCLSDNAQNLLDHMIEHADDVID